MGEKSEYCSGDRSGKMWAWGGVRVGVKARSVDSDARCQFGFCALWKFGVGSGGVGVRMGEVGGCAVPAGTWNRLSAQREWVL